MTTVKPRKKRTATKKAPKGELVEIKIPMPEGYTFVRYGKPEPGDSVLDENTGKIELIPSMDYDPEHYLSDMVYAEILTREEKAVKKMEEIIAKIQNGRKVCEFIQAEESITVELAKGRGK